jgi:hypothetical protein
VLRGASASGRAVRDEPDCLVVRLGVEEVDRVLQDARGAVVVLGSDDDEAVEGRDRRGPPASVLVLVLPERRRERLV